MLYALLHHKLDETVPEPQRLEDALTSTVFGTLVTVDQGEVLAAWLGRARRLGGAQEEVTQPRINGVWFWPQLALAEPDVVLRLGDQLFAIEAKYRADRHDAPEGEHPDPDKIHDQLCRQWESLHGEHIKHPALPDDLRDAMRSCQKTLVFLVDRRRLHRAQREFDQSVDRLPKDADARILTWQSLHDILSERDRAPARWSIVLRRYLKETGLDDFVGLRRTLPADTPGTPGTRVLLQWRRDGSSHGAMDMRQVFANSTDSFSTLARWCVDRAAVQKTGNTKDRPVAIGPGPSSEALTLRDIATSAMSSRLSAVLEFCIDHDGEET